MLLSIVFYAFVLSLVLYIYATMVTGWFLRLYLSDKTEIISDLWDYLRHDPLAKRVVYPLIQRDWTLKKQNTYINNRNTLTMLAYLLIGVVPMSIFLVTGILNRSIENLLIAGYAITVHVSQVGLVLRGYHQIRHKHS